MKGFILSVKTILLLTLITFGFHSLSADKTIVFMGDSLTAGYGVGNDRAFPALIQDQLDEEGFAYRVMNAGVSGETSAGGLSRINWLLKRPIDIFVLELGANDGLRGQSVKSTKTNLTAILKRVKEKYPEAQTILAGMQVPPNMGPDYAGEFKSAFAEVAEETGAYLIPFILEGVGGIEGLNQADGIHPNPEGHVIIKDLVWKHLEPFLEK